MKIIKASMLSRYPHIAKKYEEDIDNVVERFLTGDVCVIPNIYDIAYRFPELQKEYLKLYGQKYMQVGDLGEVDNNVKILQAVASEGPVIAININDGSHSVYTASESMVSNLTDSGHHNEMKTYEYNISERVNCMRLDITNQGGDDISIKAVNLNKNTSVTRQTHVILPYWLVRSVFRVLARLMSKNSAIKITQETQGGSQYGYYTSKISLMKQYSDHWVTTIPKPKIFPYAMHGYFPRLGSPSTSSMQDRIDLINISKIEKIPSLGEAGVVIERPDPNPLENIAREGVLSTFVWVIFNSDDPEHLKVRKKLIQFLKKRGVNISGNSGPFEVQKSINKGLQSSDKADLWRDIVPPSFHTYLLKISKYFNRLDQLDVPVTRTHLLDILDNHILLLFTMSRNSKMRKLLVTNNRELLTAFCGSRYAARFESKAGKAYEALRLFEQGVTAETIEARTGYNMTNDREAIGLRKYLDEYEGSPAGKNNVYARQLFTPDRSFYIANIPVESIYRALIVG